MIQWKTLLTVGSIFCLATVLSACAEPNSEVANSKSSASSSSTPSALINGGGPAAGLVINCPPTATVGGTATCASIISGTFSSLSWTVNATSQANSNSPTYTWTSIASAGTYRIQLTGFTTTGALISSNTFDVVVSVAPVTNANPVLTIACPLTATVGMNATCTASSSAPLASGYWTVNGTKQAGSDDVYSYTWMNIASAGTFKIQGVALSPTGVLVKSNEISVVVSPAPLTPAAAKITIVCPANIVAGGSGTCGSVSTASLGSIYWTVDGIKQPGTDGMTMVTWTNIPAGTYKVQAIALTAAGVVVKSNEFSVVVTPPPPVSIVCLQTVHVGEIATCTGTATIPLASGYWTIDGVKVEGSENLVTLTSAILTDANIGDYSLQVVVFDANGTRYLSNTVTVRVLAR